MKWWLVKSPIFGNGVTFEQIIDSYYAQVLVETGFFGLLAFVALIASLFTLGKRVYRQHPSWWARAFALGYIGALCGLLIHGISAITFVIVRIMEPFWAATGILAGLSYQMSDSLEEQERERLATSGTTDEIAERVQA